MKCSRYTCLLYILFPCLFLAHAATPSANDILSPRREFVGGFYIIEMRGKAEVQRLRILTQGPDKIPIVGSICSGQNTVANLELLSGFPTLEEVQLRPGKSLPYDVTVSDFLLKLPHLRTLVIKEADADDIRIDWDEVARIPTLKGIELRSVSFPSKIIKQLSNTQKISGVENLTLLLYPDKTSTITKDQLTELTHVPWLRRITLKMNKHEITALPTLLELLDGVFSDEKYIKVITIANP